MSGEMSDSVTGKRKADVALAPRLAYAEMPQQPMMAPSAPSAGGVDGLAAMSQHLQQPPPSESLMESIRHAAMAYEASRSDPGAAAAAVKRLQTEKSESAA
jgi:hypothetical protein